ncbi:MAG: hypothetical protein J7539_00005, partial [Niabella sp.]|nr:hypothetical protein [Niabella sp.]
MTVQIFKDDTAVAEAITAMMIDTISKKPDTVLCMASGDSPKKACAIFCDAIKKRQLDTSRIFLVGLDEWVGLDPE